MLSYLKNLCPHCNQAPLFTGIYSMNAACPACGVIFEKESGYFIGAMIASYFIGTFLALPVLLALVFFYELEMPVALMLIMAQILLMQPCYGCHPRFWRV